ncbi:peptidoglycan-associated lipoprotein Pal [Sphingorhabdus sp.]|uniref:peptidoglycan-associated lipoprotein Pal n=1 Tax=Sphingorhabdus sp. TaxID=1902408 RepID=UPI0035AEBC1C
MLKSAFLLAAIALTVSGCASNRPLPPAPASQNDVRASYDPAASEAERLAALQRELVQYAGSDRVFFDLDRFSLTATSRATLDRQATWLRQRPEISFTVEGHCDERGTREYNLALGERRANSVANYLMAIGIAPERIRTISYGKERPDAVGSDETSYAQNRRAVSIVFGPSRD